MEGNTGTFRWNDNPLDKIDDEDLIEPASLNDAPGSSASIGATQNNTVSKDSGNGKKHAYNSPLPPFNYRPKDIRTSTGPVSISVEFHRTSFVCSGSVDGFLKVTCQKDSNWKLGKIQVYLIGMEETLPTGKHKTKQRVFLKKWVDFQDASGVPSDAVHAGRPDENGMYRAKQATTQFSFSIPFMKTEKKSEVIQEAVSEKDGHLPSSFWNKKYGGVRYIVAGVVHVKRGLNVLTPLAVYKEIFVSETIPFELKPSFKSMLPPTSPLMAETTENIKKGFFSLNRKGAIKVNATVRVPVAEHEYETGMWTAGSVGWVGIEIKNASTRKVTDLTVSLVRRLKTFGKNEAHKGLGPTLSNIGFDRSTVSQRVLTDSKPPLKSGFFIISSNLAGGGYAEDEMGGTGMDRLGLKDHPFWEGVAPDETRALVVDVAVPLSARTVRYGELVDVSYTVEVTVKAKGCKPIQLTMPVLVVHPIALLKELPPLKLNAENLGYMPSSPAKLENRNEGPPLPKRQPVEVDLDSDLDAISAKEGTIIHELSELTLPPENYPTAAEISEVLPAPLISRDTLLRKSKLGQTLVMPTRSATLTRGNPYTKNMTLQPNSSSTLSTYMTLRKANMPSLLSSKDQSLPQTVPPPPPGLPPSISALKSNTNTRRESNATDVWRSSESIELGEPENLKDVPKMDLENEIDKLFSCVPIE